MSKNRKKTPQLTKILQTCKMWKSEIKALNNEDKLYYQTKIQV